jgi:hypothetical protein
MGSNAVSEINDVQSDAVSSKRDIEIELLKKEIEILKLQVELLKKDKKMNKKNVGEKIKQADKRNRNFSAGFF